MDLEFAAQSLSCCRSVSTDLFKGHGRNQGCIVGLSLQDVKIGIGAFVTNVNYWSLVASQCDRCCTNKAFTDFFLVLRCLCLPCDGDGFPVKSMALSRGRDLRMEEQGEGRGPFIMCAREEHV